MKDRTAGMVTAELAVALPAVALVLALCVAGISLGVDQVRCVDAVRVGARAAARGDPGAQVRAIVAARAPKGSVASVGSDATGATVSVEGPPPVLLAAVGWRSGCAARAVTPVEVGAR